MPIYVKQNTATTIVVGPFLDATDGKTPEVALTATSEHGTLVWDNAGSPALALDADLTAAAGDNDFVHITNDDAGYYSLELTAANVNYVGNGKLSINYVTDHLPVFHELVALPAQQYDSLIGGTDVLQVHATEIANNLITAAAVADGAIDAATFAAGAINAAAIADAAIDAATFAAGAINAAAIADAAIDAATFAVDVDAEIATMVWNAATASYGGAGTYGQAVEDVLADTGTDGVVVAAGSKTGYSLAADQSAVTIGTVSTLTGHTAQTGDTFAIADGASGFVAIATAIAALNDLAAADVWDLASALTLDFGTLVERLYQMVNNKMAVTEANGNVALRNLADSGDIATGNVASSSGTTTRAALAWV